MHDDWYEAFFVPSQIDCGPMAFKVYSIDDNTELVEISDYSSVLYGAVSYDSLNGIIVDTSHPDLAGDHTLGIKAYLLDYPDIESNLL